MNMVIKGPGGNELEWSNKLPTGLRKFNWPADKLLCIQSQFGKMVFNNYKGDGFDIWFSNYLIDHSTTLIGEVDMPGLELHIQFFNRLKADWDCIGKKIVRQDQYNLTYTPWLKSATHFESANHYTTFDIHFTFDYLAGYYGDIPAVHQFLENVAKNKPAQLFSQDHMLTPYMKMQIRSILDCPYSGPLADRHISARITDLLVNMLDRASGVYPCPVPLSNGDVEKLENAAQILLTNYDKRFTIPELARKVGLNRKKLKMGFKQLFGKTVYEFGQKAKMTKAAELLLGTEMSIDEIAVELAYSSASSLCTPFKKHFNMTPEQFRYQKKSRLIKPAALLKNSIYP